jgi:hypothetical protein
MSDMLFDVNSSSSTTSSGVVEQRRESLSGKKYRCSCWREYKRNKIITLLHAAAKESVSCF